MQDRGLPLPVDLGEMRSSCPSSIRLWPARRNQTLTMKPLRPQFPLILIIYCFCMLQIPSSGFPQPLADPPDGLDIVQLEQLAYCLSQWASLSRQPKDNQDIYKRFLFHYSRTQEVTHPVKSEGSGTAAVDFTKKDHTATWGRPFFLFRPRNGRNTEDEAQ
uniref:neuromedin-S isoform X4 n=1 Tax=Macaca mulatta TaxID=9544 RepID=UPI0010A27A26|nr:neuromedin-S isoform X4 [Macaca mulatta]